jgi:hypothetical protein
MKEQNQRVIRDVTGDRLSGSPLVSADEHPYDGNRMVQK